MCRRFKPVIDYCVKVWQLNRMIHEGGTVYIYTTSASIGSNGAYYFLNDDQWGERESIPSECAVYWDSDRGYSIPENSNGETFSYVWSSCEEIQPVSALGRVSINNKSLIEIYPNPVMNNQLHLSFKKEDMVNIEILDLLGQLYYRRDIPGKDIESYTLDLSHLHSGMYLLRVVFIKENKCESKLFILYD